MGSGWSTGDEDHFVALAEFDFDGEKDDELSLRRGQRINVAPKGQYSIDLIWYPYPLGTMRMSSCIFFKAINLILK